MTSGIGGLGVQNWMRHTKLVFHSKLVFHCIFCILRISLKSLFCVFLFSLVFSLLLILVSEAHYADR